MNKVTVLGSINLDRTIRTSRMPQGGETIHTKEIFSAGGGKGANQAVAAQRLNANTYFIGAVGEDKDGQLMLDLLSDEGIGLEAVQTLTGVATGQAFVIVDDEGENRILVHGGANMALTPELIQASEALIKESDCLISQFEVPLPVIEAAFKVARDNDVLTILNPAPALNEVPESLLKLTDIIIPNETETEILTGIAIRSGEDMHQAADYFHSLGIRTVIITLGSKGAFYDIENGASGIVPAFKVEAKDTTAAGDTFIGAFASALNKDMSNIEDAIRFGNKASSIAVQRFGAQPSIPFYEEMDL